MNIYIITVFNSDNSGAFLQAWALGRLLSSRYDVLPVYVNTGARSPTKSFLKKAIRDVARLNPARLAFHLKSNRAFREDWNTLGSIKCREVPEGSVLVLGSDEIWNLSRQKEIAAYPAFWGDGIKSDNIISYAPSTNGANIENCKQLESFIRCLKNYKGISVRDEDSAKAIEKVTGISPAIVCDPTLLLDASDYSQLEKGYSLPRRYIAVYSYGEAMTQEEIAEIRQFAAHEDLDVISIGNWLSWCDSCIPCSAGGFLGLIRDAAYVVTDTFHGLMASAIYGKRMAVYPHGKSKVKSALDALNLLSRDCSTDTLSNVLSQPVNSTNLSNSIIDLRKQSLHYLDSALEECEIKQRMRRW